jgi:hypothetical protein
MAKKATQLMREATYRWAIWRAEGTLGELDLACRLAHEAQAWAARQRQPVLARQGRRLVEALERERREYDARCRPLVEAAARAQEIIPADELEAGTVGEAPTPLYVPEGVFFVRGERVWNVRTGRGVSSVEYSRANFAEGFLHKSFH